MKTLKDVQVNCKCKVCSINCPNRCERCHLCDLGITPGCEILCKQKGIYCIRGYNICLNEEEANEILVEP